MHVFKTNFNKNPNVGLYGFATDEYCLLGLDVPEKYARHIEGALHVPVHRMNVCGTSLLGVFCAGNNNCLLIPNIVFKSELRKLEHLKIKNRIIETEHTALGNNILANDFGCIASGDFTASARQKISNALCVEVEAGTIAKYKTVGSFAVANNKGCIAHLESSRLEIRKIEKLLAVKCTPTTINFGSPYLKSGIIANSKGFVIGDDTGPVEINEVDRAFGFLIY